jgi:hypothetical protein
MELVHGLMDRVHRAQFMGPLHRGCSNQDGGLKFYEIKRLFSNLISVVGVWFKGHNF